MRRNRLLPGRISPTDGAGSRRPAGRTVWRAVLACTGAAATVVLLLSVAAGQEAEPDARDQAEADFSDLGEAGVHETAVRRLAAEGIFDGTGCTQGLFCPGEPLERWTMAVWLVRILDSREPPDIAESRFSDVDPDTWWAPHVERLAELEVTAGCSTDPPQFCPTSM